MFFFAKLLTNLAQQRTPRHLGPFAPSSVQSVNQKYGQAQNLALVESRSPLSFQYLRQRSVSDVIAGFVSVL
jgi:hypothetical protein